MHDERVCVRVTTTIVREFQLFKNDGSRNRTIARDSDEIGQIKKFRRDPRKWRRKRRADTACRRTVGYPGGAEGTVSVVFADAKRM